MLSNKLYLQRKNNKRPEWIGENTWRGLFEESAKEDHQKMNQVNKEKELGYTPGLVESFLHTHSSLDDKGERKWMDEHSENTYEKELGYKPGLVESFLHTHSSLDDKGERKWVDEHLENTYKNSWKRWMQCPARVPMKEMKNRSHLCSLKCKYG